MKTGNLFLTAALSTAACSNYSDTTTNKLDPAQSSIADSSDNLYLEKLPRPSNQTAVNLGPNLIKHRWFGLKKAGDACPEPEAQYQSYWKSSQLQSRHHAGGASDILADICIYEATKENPAPRRQQLPFKQLLALHPDRAAIQAMGNGNQQSAYYAERFRRQNQLPSTANLGLFENQKKQQPVDIALIDSASKWTHQGVEDHSGHGRAIGRVISEITCPEGDLNTSAFCAGRISNYQALGEEFGKEESKRGAFGTFYTVSHALDQAISQWLSQPAKLRRKLIINLSLGWLPMGQELSLGEQAVLEQLKIARCHGAMIVAASGNYSGGPIHHQGALLPAAWAGLDAPQSSQCSSQGRKLLIPVGAHDNDRPLAISWPGSIPRQMAAGAAIVTRDWRQAPFYGELDFSDKPYKEASYLRSRSGSSFAAAAFTGLASLVWTEKPQLSADDIEDFIYRTSRPTNLLTEFDHLKSNDRPAALSVCSALETICGSSKSQICQQNLPGCSMKASTLKPPLRSENNRTVAHLSRRPNNPCGANFFASSGSQSINECRHQTTASRFHTPTVGPQPPEDPCDVCEIQGGNLYIEISGSLDPNYTLEDVTLEIEAQGTTYFYDLSSFGTFQAGTTMYITNLNLPNDISHGQLNYIASGPQGDYAGSDEVVIFN